MKFLLSLGLALVISLPLIAQQRAGRDPLTAEESDKLRDTAMQPNKRLKLYVAFARARIASMDQVLADPKAKNGPQQMHDLLQDFATLADEIADNVDTFSGQQWDIRKSLKLVIEADSEFQLRLRKLSDLAKDPKTEADAEAYKFVLRDASESLANNADDARKTMQEQNALAKEKKLKKEDDSQ